MSRAGRRIVAALTVAAAGSAVGGAVSHGVSPLALVPLLPAGVLFVIAGAAAASRRPDGPSGRLLAAAGLSWLGAQAFFTLDQRVAFVGSVLFPLGLAFLAHLAVAYPDGVKSRAEQVVVSMPYGLVLALLPLAIAGGDDFITAGPEGTFERTWYAGLLVAALVTAICFLIILVGRWRHGTAVARRVLLPIVPGGCLFVLIYIVALLAELGVPTGLGGRWGLVGILLVGAAPLVFLAGLLRARLVRAKVGGLVVELGGTSGRDGLRDALARALRDPTVEVAYWMAEEERYVDEHGRALELPEPGGLRMVTRIERAGRPIGALTHDAALAEDQAHVDAVCAAAGLALENQRLHAEVLSRLEEVRASRARIVEAGDTARKRVERNLHDGAQQRLVAISIAVGMARSKLSHGCPDEADALLSQSSQDAVTAITELRELTQGLNPSILAEAGLMGAVESLAERSFLPVTLRGETSGDLPASVEAAAYYVVAEALSNAAKHAGATSVCVLVEQGPDLLAVEITDDGSGGAGVRSGGGLEGLADRVAALDGRLTVQSAPGGGTVVRAELPCA
ncbi:MAG TPA: histidine kinase [Acidimicrobiales bacterium]|nr:histidine kinase [Acidimicrobiales bacterium]